MGRTKTDILEEIDCVENSKMLDHNTVQYSVGNNVFIRLHDTDIISYIGNREIILSSGGWKTMTTKDRLNKFVRKGVMIYSDKGLWYIMDKYGNKSEFYDGIALTTSWKIKNKRQVSNKTKRIIKMIKEYSDRVGELEKLPMPSGGDCWHCSMFTDDGRTLGEISRSDHIFEHIRTKYIHGSIIVNAMRWAGYRDEGISMAFNGFGNWRIKGVMRRYLRKQFGLPI